jgi:hypothetical protein
MAVFVCERRPRLRQTFTDKVVCVHIVVICLRYCMKSTGGLTSNSQYDGWLGFLSLGPLYGRWLGFSGESEEYTSWVLDACSLLCSDVEEAHNSIT